jgi:selenide, water dikinase
MSGPRAATGTDDRRVLILVGGGHAHVQLVASAAPPPPNTRRILISDGPAAVYSGMLPSIVAGLLPASDADVRLDALAAAHGWEFLDARVVEVDAHQRTLTCSPSAHGLYARVRQIVRFDVLSLDVGSVSKPLVKGNAHIDLQRASHGIIPTRPIGLLLARMRFFETSMAPSVPVVSTSGRKRVVRVVVVGGGRAGVELAFSLDARLRRTLSRASLSMTIVDGSQTSLKQLGPAASIVHAELASRGIALLSRRRVVGLPTNGTLLLDDGSVLPADLVVAATGPAAPPWLANATDLVTDARGFLLVRPTLQAVDHPHVFAAGDCCSFKTDDSPPKAGVFAVRAGKILESNISAYLADEEERLTPFVPQTNYLSLIVLGDGRAIGIKWSLVVRGRWVAKLKMRIDEDWQERFRVPEPLPPETANIRGCSDNTWEGSPEDAAVALFQEKSTEGDDYVRQYTILKRMDADDVFRDLVLKITANRFYRAATKHDQHGQL